MSPEILESAQEVRNDRMEVPVNLPESIDVAILQEAIRQIDVYLDHYREGRDGTGFRKVNRSEVKNITKAQIDRQQIVMDAADQLEWILSDEVSCGKGVTFTDICDAQGIQDIPTFRQSIMDILFGTVHQNALQTLQDYLKWREKFNANRDSEWSDHPPTRKLQTAY